MSAGRRRAGVIVGAAVAALIALHGAAWLWGTERLRGGYEAWAAAMRTAGWVVDAGAPERAGWPLAAELVLPGASLVGGDAVVPGGLAWAAERVRLRLTPLAPGSFDVVAEGVQHVRLVALPEAAVTAEALAARVPLSGDAATEVRGRAVRVSAAGDAVEAATLRAWVTPGSVRAEAGEIALPRGYAWPLGATITAASVDFSVLGGSSPAPPGATAGEQARRWRDAGGHVDVRSLGLQWGPLGVTGSGSGGLDAGLQPRGEAMLRLQGWDAALDRLAAGGAIAPGTALASRAALGLFARASQGTAPGGGVSVPVVVRDGLVYAGGIPLVRVPRIEWR